MSADFSCLFTFQLKSAVASLFQFDWVCDDAWKPAFTQSMFFCGAIFGALIFGWISDRYGRCWALLLSHGLITATGLATPFTTDFISFTVLKLLMGFGHPTFCFTFYLLSNMNLEIS